MMTIRFLLWVALLAGIPAGAWEGFRVLVNGRAVAIHEARVSKAPINRVWPGKQRPLDQTETAWFATFDMAAPVEVRIELPAEQTLRKVEIRPFSAQIKPKAEKNTITFRLDRPRQLTLETDGRHRVLHLFANAPAEPYRSCEGDLYFPPGVHEAGIIFPRDNQTVYLAEGAVVYGAIFAYKVKNVTIAGRGILDSSRLKRGELAKNAPGKPGSELLDVIRELKLPIRDLESSGSLVAYGCENLRIEGIILRDSMFWTLITRNGCRNVVIDNVKIIGQWRYNSDGIDICCSENVTVRNCFIRSFDDCLVVRGTCLPGEGRYPVRNITVENCVMWCDWGKSLEIWLGWPRTEVENVVFRNIDLIRLENVALDITTWARPNRPNRTFVRNVTFQDIRIDPDDAQPESVYQDCDSRRYPDRPRIKVPHLIRVDRRNLEPQAAQKPDIPRRDLRYENLSFIDITSGGRKLPVEITGEPEELRIDRVLLRNVDAGDIRTESVTNLQLEP